MGVRGNAFKYVKRPREFRHLVPCLGSVVDSGYLSSSGVNEGDKCLVVRNLLREWKAYVICFQETKLESMSTSIVRSLWGCHYVD